MKITIVAGFLLPIPPVQGGAMEKTWHRLARMLATRGHEITFISRRWPGWPDEEVIDGVRHLRLKGANHTRYLALNLLLDFIWGVRVTRALPTADFVITNTVAMPVWLRRLKPTAGRVVSVMARMPKGQTRFYGQVDLLLSLSTAVTRRIIAENPSLDGRIEPFPLPIDWAGLSAASNRSTPLTIGYIGRLNPEKGIPLLLAAATRLAKRADLPAWRLRLTGPISVPAGGGGESWLTALRTEYGSALANRLEILPPEFDPALLARRYGEIDIFCYPSLAEQGETFGVAVAEAMAAGCVPIVSGLACFNELVEHQKSGLVFDHNAPDADVRLAECVARLLLNDELRHTLAKQAQSHVLQFDFEQVTESLLARLSVIEGAAIPLER